MYAEDVKRTWGKRGRKEEVMTEKSAMIERRQRGQEG